MFRVFIEYGTHHAVEGTRDDFLSLQRASEFISRKVRAASVGGAIPVFSISIEAL